jgi:acetyl-CoA acyltransferase
MTNAYIVAPMRSAGGKAHRGTLRHKRPDDLAADIIKELVARTKIDPATVDDVIVGCAMPEAEQGMNFARIALLLAGLPESVPGVTVNRFCSSGVQTIGMAASAIKAGDAECIIAGGAESMTAVPMMGHKVVGSRNIMDNSPVFYLGMGMTAENVAKDFNISREDQDKFAVTSHQKAAAAVAAGHFKDEIVPVTATFRTPGENGNVEVNSIQFDADEGIRADTSVEGLAKLRTPFLTGGSVTAGNTSQMTDGAGFCLVCSEDYVKKNNLTPIARLASFSVAGVAPRIMGIGPIEAIPKACAKAGIKQNDIQRIELNEAFAAQSLAVMRSLDLNPDIVNPTGGAIALGHPLGATGGKLTATLLHGMKRDKQKYGMVTMCIGTGMGAAAIYEML